MISVNKWDSAVVKEGDKSPMYFMNRPLGKITGKKKAMMCSKEFRILLNKKRIDVLAFGKFLKRLRIGIFQTKY